jgi:RNA polymerase-binding transcription factor DksA
MVSLAEIGFDWYDLTMTSPDDPGAAAKARRAAELGTIAVEKAVPDTKFVICEYCKRPIDYKRRSRGYCSKKCSNAAAYARRRQAQKATAEERKSLGIEKRA